VSPRRSASRRVAILIVVALAAVASLAIVAVASAAPAKGAKHRLTEGERAFLGKLDTGYAWEVMLKQVYGWGVPDFDPWFNQVVGGTAGSEATIDALAAEMAAIGLAPGGDAGGYTEAFPIDGWEDLGSSAAVVSPYRWSVTPVHQAYKGAGTGPGGVTAPLVDVGKGRWADFEKAGDISGKIVLLHRADPMFYGGPSLAEAKARGAVGALMDYPITGKEILKTDEIAEFIPTLYIRQVEWNRLAADLKAGKDLRVKLIVNNEVGDYPTARNVVGMIPGSVYPDEFIYLGCHFDHWMTSAADDGAGVGSMFAIAKAVKAMQAQGWQPKRTLVFCAFDSEELGGPPDTWYDWCLGSFSHIVGRLPGSSNPSSPYYKEWDDGDLLPAIHGERAGRIVAMLNMDVIGVKNATVFIESTPDVTSFFQKAADDSGLSDLGETWVYWPPSSYDDWQFYMAGVPCMEIAFWGPVYDKLYHTTGDVPGVLSRKSVRANMRFNALSMLRFDDSGIVRYDLDENLAVARYGIGNLKKKDPKALAAGHADIAALRSGMGAYADQLKAKSAVLKAKHVAPAEAARVNDIQMKAAKALLPHLFDWDSSGIPGWTGIFAFDTYANDLQSLNEAIRQLRAGHRRDCARALRNVTTMGWGRYVGDEAYRLVLEHIAYNPHLLWGYGFIPKLTDVHAEFMNLTGKYDSPTMTSDQILASLRAKRDAAYGHVTAAAQESGAAFAAAAAELGRL
jgi:hypothetical protein